MPIVIAECVAPVASWRPPEALTYHRTLPLPPYTTQVGLLGAALGQCLTDTYRFISARGLKLGVGGWHQGKARDLWKFHKLEDDYYISDVLLRELWIDSRLLVVVETLDHDTGEEIAAGFREPIFPLTAGTSDALVKVVAVHVEDVAPLPTRRLLHVLVYGEISPLYRPFEQIAKVPLTRTVRAPAVENLPTGFVFDARGARRLAGRELVSFVADAIELEEGAPAVVGYRVVPVSKPFLPEYTRWKEQGLEWTIPVHRYDLPQMPGDGSSIKPSPSLRKRGGPGRATGST